MTPWRQFPVFDGDSHVVEPPALWEQYLDPEYRTLGRHALWRQEGVTTSYLKVNGETFRDTMNPNLPRHALWRPGMTWDAIGELDPTVRHPMNAGASDPRARLADMDAMGIDQALLYPTWFAEGFHLVRDPDVAYALARAYNDWIADFCAAAPRPAVRRRDGAPAEHGLRARGTAARRRTSRASAACSCGRCSSRAAISPTRTTTRCGRSWSAPAWSPPCIPRRACGIRNGPRTDRSSRR